MNWRSLWYETCKANANRPAQVIDWYDPSGHLLFHVAQNVSVFVIWSAAQI